MGFPETPESTLALGTSLSEAPTLENTDGIRRAIQARQDSEWAVEAGKETQDLQGIEVRRNLMEDFGAEDVQDCRDKTKKRKDRDTSDLT